MRTLRGSRSGGVGGTGPGGRAEPSRPAEPWRPGYPAEIVAPAPLSPTVPRVLGCALPWGGVLDPQSDPSPPASPCPRLWCVPPTTPNPGLSLCRGSSWVPLPTAEPPASLAVVRWGSDRGLDQSPLNKGSRTSPSPRGREPGQSLAWSPMWGNAEPAGNVTLGGLHSTSTRRQQTHVPVTVAAVKRSRAGAAGRDSRGGMRWPLGKHQTGIN